MSGTETEDYLEAQKKQAQEIHALTVGTFGTDLGKKYLEQIIKVFVDRPIYVHGQTLEATAYRQGQADLVKQIIKEINNAR